MGPRAAGKCCPNLYLAQGDFGIANTLVARVLVPWPSLNPRVCLWTILASHGRLSTKMLTLPMPLIQLLHRPFFNRAEQAANSPPVNVFPPSHTRARAQGLSLFFSLSYSFVVPLLMISTWRSIFGTVREQRVSQSTATRNHT